MIDNTDAALVHLPTERFRCIQKTGQSKARLDLPPSGPVREAQQAERLQVPTEESGLDPGLTKRFLRFIVDEVIRYYVT